MSGIDPWAFMQDLAGRPDRLGEHAEIEAALDDLECLMEVLDPELQDVGYDLTGKLRTKLAQTPK